METTKLIKTIRRNPLTCFAGIVTAVIIGSNLGNIQKSSELDRSLADKALAIKASELSRTMDRQLAKQRLQNGCVIALQASDKTK